MQMAKMWIGCVREGPTSTSFIQHDRNPHNGVCVERHKIGRSVGVLYIEIGRSTIF